MLNRLNAEDDRKNPCEKLSSDAFALLLFHVEKCL